MLMLLNDAVVAVVFLGYVTLITCRTALLYIPSTTHKWSFHYADDDVDDNGDAVVYKCNPAGDSITIVTDIALTQKDFNF